MSVLDEKGISTSQFDTSVCFESYWKNGEGRLSKYTSLVEQTYEDSLLKHEVERGSSIQVERLKDKPKFEGCLLGLAIGDALGAPAGSLNLEKIKVKFGVSGIDSFQPWGDLTAGSYADNTQLEIATIVGCIQYAKYGVLKGSSHLPGLIHVEYLRWNYLRKYPHYSRNPETDCVNALNATILMYGLPAKNSYKDYGAVTRAAPLGLLLKPDEAFLAGIETAKLTHGHPTAYLAAGFFASTLSFILRGEALLSAIEGSIVLLLGYENHQETLASVNRAVQLAVSDVTVDEAIASLGGGWLAEEALAIALFCALRFPNDFRTGVLAGVNHSGNSGATGALVGALVGCNVGIDEVPPEWLSGVEDSAQFFELIGKFLRLASLKICEHPTEPDEIR